MLAWEHWTTFRPKRGKDLLFLLIVSLIFYCYFGFLAYIDMYLTRTAYTSIAAS